MATFITKIILFQHLLLHILWCKFNYLGPLDAQLFLPLCQSPFLFLQLQFPCVELDKEVVDPFQLSFVELLDVLSVAKLLLPPLDQHLVVQGQARLFSLDSLVVLPNLFLPGLLKKESHLQAILFSRI